VGGASLQVPGPASPAEAEAATHKERQDPSASTQQSLTRQQALLRVRRFGRILGAVIATDRE